ncbi:MAG: ribonuclease D [Arenimonas sp. SCN 70-307]|uniref:ribonuclease D n=1 Tax=Arenimonas sp. SCN 70-307 TaxID=1660089 RepID=UPI000869952F|nr:ribonuclease D [Arenimonas sp. SCN 70-307]ODS64884.1 MAG: ribonuclease D [Arenimonas sp. SCN 70-307]
MTHWIDHPDTLASRLAGWAGQPLVALDTEFIRERTYYPQLALVQLAVPGEVLLVDPLAEGMDAALRPLLTDSSVTKLMHSASEDLQALQRGCRALPAPLFDTQVAAALCGLGAGLGYQKLVEQVTGVQLAKGETRSDWLRRPLSESQCEYAADDVRHLHAVHAFLDRELAARGRHDWLRQDAERALRNAADEGDEPWPHLSLRSAQTLDREGQARLLRLLRWRDVQARRSDRPKSWVLDNELAVLLARRPPRSLSEFHATLDRHPKAPRKARGELWDTLSAPLSPGELELPLLGADEPDKARTKALQQAVATLAAELDLPDGLLCSRKHLEALLAGRGWPAALEGWRRELLEPRLAPLLAGG